MSTYTPTAVVLVDITLPADGENIEAADVNGPMQELADGIVFAQARTDVLADLTALAAILVPTDGLVRHVLGFGTYVFKTSATTGLSPFRLAADDATTGGWLSSTAHQTTVVRMVGPSRCPLRYGAAGTPDLVGPTLIPLDAAFTTYAGSVAFTTATTGSAIAVGFAAGIDDALIDGATVTQIRARVKVQNVHANLPALMPRFGVLIGHLAWTDFANATDAMLSTGSGFAVDASASGAAYSADHYITFTPNQNATVDKTAHNYSIVAYNEGHTNAQVLTTFMSFEITQTMTDARRS